MRTARRIVRRGRLEYALKLFLGRDGGKEWAAVGMAGLGLQYQAAELIFFSDPYDFSFCQDDPFATVLANEASKVFPEVRVIGVGIKARFSARRFMFFSIHAQCLQNLKQHASLLYQFTTGGEKEQRTTETLQAPFEPRTGQMPAFRISNRLDAMKTTYSVPCKEQRHSDPSA